MSLIDPCNSSGVVVVGGACDVLVVLGGGCVDVGAGVGCICQSKRGKPA